MLPHTIGPSLDLTLESMTHLPRWLVLGFTFWFCFFALSKSGSARPRAQLWAGADVEQQGQPHPPPTPWLLGVGMEGLG